MCEIFKVTQFYYQFGVLHTIYKLGGIPSAERSQIFPPALPRQESWFFRISALIASFYQRASVWYGVPGDKALKPKVDQKHPNQGLGLLDYVCDKHTSLLA